MNYDSSIYFAAMCKILRCAVKIATLCCGLIFLTTLISAGPLLSDSNAIITSVRDLKKIAKDDRSIFCAIRLEGVVLWENPNRDEIIFQDDSGGIRVKTDLRSEPFFPTGQKVLLEGEGLIGLDGLQEALVDNDGVHPSIEKSGTLYLTAGHHPIRLDWFNAQLQFDLRVSLEGPGLQHETIPDSMLYRIEKTDDGIIHWANELTYKCYEGSWEKIPDFKELPIRKVGVVTNFDLAVRTQDTNAGIQFTGFINIPRTGLYTFGVRSDDGSRLFVGNSHFTIETNGGISLPMPEQIFPGQPLTQNQDCKWSVIEGVVTFASEHSGTMDLEINSGTGLMGLHVAATAVGTSRSLLNSRVRVTGISQSVFNSDGQRIGGVLLVPDVKQIEMIEPATLQKTDDATKLPILTKIEQVKSLPREEALKGYPVKVRGIITAPTYGGFFIQDGIWAIYVRWNGLVLQDTPRTGDYWEIEGTTYVDFAPNIQAIRAVRLGTGIMPEPLHPTPDQFVNGSLDTRYVEIRGVVTAVTTNELQMLTPLGRIQVQLSDIDPALGQPAESDLKQYENAVVRIRGCAIPGRDYKTQQVQSGNFWIWLCNYAIAVDQPAPSDLFSASVKTVAELRSFNPHASILERVKVSGQILHKQGDVFFLWDGTNGLRFIPEKPINLQVGDMAAVVGFPDLSGSALILREAMARAVGHAALPPPRQLSDKLLLNREYDGNRVQIQARLTDISTESSDKILTLQSGAHGFIARLNSRGPLRDDILPGSLIELIGIYSSLGANSTDDQNIASFELLLNSQADIAVLEHPSWWTLRRLVVVLGAILLFLAGALLWIFTLKRQVNAQALMIHQKVEREATLEERARIARDIHDTLEQALAGTSLQLNALADSLPDVSPEPSRILKVARSMINHAQDEARRTVRNLRLLNLEKNNLPTALSQFAAQTGIDLQIKILVNVDGVYQPLPGQVENHLLRIGQEAVTNAIKHAGAKNIIVELKYDLNPLELSIQDDGCGFDAAHALGASAGHFGLLGMRERAEKIGGTLEIKSFPGQGTTITVKVKTTA